MNLLLINAYADICRRKDFLKKGANHLVFYGNNVYWVT